MSTHTVFGAMADGRGITDYTPECARYSEMWKASGASTGTQFREWLSTKGVSFVQKATAEPSARPPAAPPAMPKSHR